MDISLGCLQLQQFLSFFWIKLESMLFSLRHDVLGVSYLAWRILRA
jgi:hypothetical protein